LLSQTPDRSPVSVSPGETVDLTIGFDGERPSSARALVDGDIVAETELDSEATEWAFEFAGEDPGHYEVALVVEGTFPDRLGHLYEQDALEFSDTAARAEWDVVIVDPDEQVSTFARIWHSVKDVLALYTLTMIVRKAYAKVENARDSLGRTESEEHDDDLTTLDDFIDEESTQNGEEPSDRNAES
jgi:hypothetical protein